MRYYLLLSLLLVASCADYRYQKQDNPFSQYGIKTLSIPMFYNQSNFNNISPVFTKEIYKILSGFKGLELRSGKKNADATLIGIVGSASSLKDSRSGANPRAAKSILGENFANNRNDFAIPSTNNLAVSLKIIVMKHPTEEEIKLLSSDLGNAQVINSKIIFNDIIPISGSFTREIFGPEGAEVIATQNRGAQKNTIKGMAQSAAVSFRDMILYAF